MENYYKCVVNKGTNRSTVIICTEKTFPNQYNKNKKDQFQELIELAYDEVVASADAWESINRDNLEFVYYKKMTKQQVDSEIEDILFEKWFDEMEEDDDADDYDDYYDEYDYRDWFRYMIYGG